MENYSAGSSIALFIALHELRAGDRPAAAEWVGRSLQLAIDHGPTFIAQAISATVAVAKRDAPAAATVLLGALRAHRTRRQQAGTPPEIDGETRYETSLRRTLGDQFDARYAEGSGLDDTAMVTYAFTQLDAIAKTHERAEGAR